LYRCKKEKSKKENKMKKALTILVLMALGVSTAFGGVFMVEDYTEGSVYIPNPGEHKLATVTFELPQPSVIHVITGRAGHSYGGCPSYSLKFWLNLNGTPLSMSFCSYSNTPALMKELEAGSYILDFMSKGAVGDTIVNPRLQVLVLYNDVPSVSETPPNIIPTENPSIISCGPSVTVPGCCEVVDVSGRKVDCEINGDRIMVNSLSSGTYFATGSNGRTTKIVKLK
jgi:hypothetical protein